MSEMRYDGRVAVVTGAGAGLGRSYALLLASRGAKVVVNDLGGSRSGDGKSAAAADKVVAEITAAGGTAVPNYDSVEFGDKIIQTAIDTWGRVDIVINNAGILRDGSFQKMTPEQWDLVIRVHLKGTYKVTRAAWNHMRSNNYGRIVMVTSSSGVFGNFGQTNYAAAKMAILGLANTLAREGAKRNILVNTIAPVAASRMTEDVFPPDLFELLKPEAVAPLVAFLAHESCDLTGQLYEAGAGWFSSLRWQRTKGAFLDIKDGKALTPEAVRDAWPTVTDWTDATNPDSTQSAFEPIMSNLAGAGAGAGDSTEDPLEAALTSKKKKTSASAPPAPAGGHPKSDAVDVGAALAHPFEPCKFSYTERDAALYALTVGSSDEPLDETDLPFTYELAADGFKVLPTMAVLFAFEGMGELIRMPSLQFNPMMLLHGEQEIRLDGPLPTSGTIVSDGRISSIYDKGKGALITMDFECMDEATGRRVATSRSSVFIRGIGGFGGPRGPKPEAWAIPSRAPDAVDEFKTSSNQALFYRLNGDTNPLHADPAMAAMGGFDKPILHGLCSFGVAGRGILRSFCDGDVNMFKAMKSRFSSHVFPGETIVTEMWQEGSKVIFQCKVAERGTTCLTNGVVELATSAKL